MSVPDSDGGGAEGLDSWRSVRSTRRVPRSEMECFNCYEKGHERRQCTNDKRIKCFNCDEIGHVMRNCGKPPKEVDTNRKEGREVDKETEELARRLSDRRWGGSTTKMTTIEAVLEVEKGKMKEVTRELGIKILQILDIKPEEVMGRDKEIWGIQERGARIEFWLHPKSNLDKYLLEDVTVLIKEGIKLIAMREVGTRVRRLRFRKVPFSVDNKEIVQLLERVGRVISPVTWVLDSKMGVYTGERVADIELNPGKYIPSRVVLGGMEVSVWYPGQKRTCISCHAFIADCEAGGETARCRALGGGRKVVQAVAEYYKGIGLEVGSWQREDEDDGEVEVPDVYVSPIKQPGIERKLKHAGLVIKKKMGLDLGKVEQYLTAALANIPEDERNGPGEIEEHDRSFTIRLGHEMSNKVREQLVDIYDLSVNPLVDALSGQVQILVDDEEENNDEEEVEEEMEDEAEQETENEKSKKGNNVTVIEVGHGAGFESLVMAANVEASKKDKGEDELCLSLFPYKVPVDKSDETYQDMLQERRKELDGLCRSGSSFRRNPSVGMVTKNWKKRMQNGRRQNSIFLRKKGKHSRMKT